jgi:hypothetical protein
MGVKLISLVLLVVAVLAVSGQFDFQAAQNWVQYALKTQEAATNGSITGQQFFDRLMYNDTEIWLPEVALPAPYPAQYYSGPSLLPGVLGFIASIPVRPWVMSFVQYGAVQASSDTAWITGAEKWLLNGSEVRTLPVDAVQGRSYLVRYYPAVGYRFRSIQVFPLQCTSASCVRPASRQTTSPAATLNALCQSVPFLFALVLFQAI